MNEASVSARATQRRCVDYLFLCGSSIRKVVLPRYKVWSFRRLSPRGAAPSAKATCQFSANLIPRNTPHSKPTPTQGGLPRNDTLRFTFSESHPLVWAQCVCGYTSFIHSFTNGITPRVLYSRVPSTLWANAHTYARIRISSLALGLASDPTARRLTVLYQKKVQQAASAAAGARKKKRRKICTTRSFGRA